MILSTILKRNLSLSRQTITADCFYKVNKYQCLISETMIIVATKAVNIPMALRGKVLISNIRPFPFLTVDGSMQHIRNGTYILPSPSNMHEVELIRKLPYYRIKMLKDNILPLNITYEDIAILLSDAMVNRIYELNYKKPSIIVHKYPWDISLG